MEKLIIQVGSRHGKLANIVECKKDSMKIGRSFANDVVLSDPYVAPEQIEINNINDRWLIRVLDDTNPVMLNGNPVKGIDVEVHSGDRLTLGRTHVYVFSRDHKFEKTRKLLFSGWLYHNRMGPFIPVMTVVLASCISFFQAYLGLSREIEYRPLISGTLMLILLISLWAASWSLIGRLLRNQLSFFINLMFTAAAVSLYMILYPLGEYIEYLSGSLVIYGVYNSVLFLIILSIILRFNLSISTHLKNSGMVAFLFSLALVLFSYGINEFNKNEFSEYAVYANKLKPPFSKVVANNTIDEYMVNIDGQFTELDDLIDDE